MGIIYFIYFALGPHPQRLCLRGLRRSALLVTTARSVYDFALATKRDHGNEDDPAVSSRLYSVLSVVEPFGCDCPLGVAVYLRHNRRHVRDATAAACRATLIPQDYARGRHRQNVVRALRGGNVPDARRLALSHVRVQDRLLWLVNGRPRHARQSR